MSKKTIFLPSVFILLLSTMMVEGSASPLATVYISPKESNVKVCQIFKIDVNVANVSGLQGFDFSLGFDANILDALNVTEGSFMRDAGLTVFTSEIGYYYQPTLGLVWFAMVVCGNVCVNGSGTLATITFNATAPGESLLDLGSTLPLNSDEVKLATCAGEHIPNVAVDGHVVVSSDPYDPPEDPPNPPDPPDTPPSPDINRDGIVNIKDLAKVVSLYGISVGDPRYNLDADLDRSGTIDVRDVATVARHFGEAL